MKLLHSLLFIAALVVPALAASSIDDLVLKACTEVGMDQQPLRREASKQLLQAGWDNERSFALALPYISWKSDLPGFPTGVKIALKRYFDSLRGGSGVFY